MSAQFVKVCSTHGYCQPASHQGLRTHLVHMPPDQGGAISHTCMVTGRLWATNIFKRVEGVSERRSHLGAAWSRCALQPLGRALFVHDVLPARAIGVATIRVERSAQGLVAGDAAVLRTVPAAAHHEVIARQTLRKLPLADPHFTLLTSVVLTDVPTVIVLVHPAWQSGS